MNEKYPIQIVKTRGEKDLFKKEATPAGDPQWITDDEINRNCTSILHSLSALRDELEDNKNNERLPIILTAKLNEHAKSKKFRGSVRSVFDRKGKRNVIGKSKGNSVFVKIDSASDLEYIENNVEEHKTKDKMYGVASIQELERYKPDIDNKLVGTAVKVKLIDYLDERTNSKAKDLFLKKLRESGTEVKQTQYTDNLTIYSIDKVTQATMDSLATMDGILTVKPLPHYEIEVAPDPTLTKIDIVSPQPGEEYPMIGLLDSGVDTADTPHLQPWVEEENTAGLEEFDIDRMHGTAVAGILLYGDALEGLKLTGTSPTRIKSFIVNTSPNKSAIIDETEMVEYVRDAISTNPEIKIWNLSQGSMEEVADDEFSDFAIVLDDLQKKHNVLICKSAGNIHPALPHKMRITHGADSLLSVVVGSIAHIKQREDDAEPGCRSPFSRIGFGPCNTIKPDVVHYGGNTSIGVNSFAVTGFQTSCRIQGTSFSTPRVSALAASLSHRLGAPFRPDVIKAMILHHSEYPTQEKVDSETLAKEYGAGLPKDVDTMLTNNPDEFTMVWPMELTKDAEIRILDFPFPESLVDENGFFYGEITLTMACVPSLKSTENSEYCQSNLDIKLQTYDHVDNYILGAAGTPERFRNESRSVDAQNILTASRYSSPSFKAAAYSEKTIIPENKDFQSALKFHVNLEKMRNSQRETCLKQGRKWCVNINPKFRDSIETDFSKSGVTETIRATIIVTIRDPKKKGIVYEECYQQLENRNFNHTSVNVGILQKMEVKG